MSPSKRSKKKSKRGSASFQAALDEAFATQAQEVADGASLEQKGKVDTQVMFLGCMANGAVKAVGSLTGLGTDEEIQEQIVTGENAWQNTNWGDLSSDGEE